MVCMYVMHKRNQILNLHRNISVAWSDFLVLIEFCDNSVRRGCVQSLDGRTRLPNSGCCGWQGWVLISVLRDTSRSGLWNSVMWQHAEHEPRGVHYFSGLVLSMLRIQRHFLSCMTCRVTIKVRLTDRCVSLFTDLFKDTVRSWFVYSTESFLRSSTLSQYIIFNYRVHSCPAIVR
jgi:hypothetical protein